MLKKYLLFLIIITIAATMATNTRAADYAYYVTLTIKSFETGVTGGAGATTMKFEQNSNSPIEVNIYDGGSLKYDGSAMTASRSYGVGDTMTVGPVTLTEGNSHTFRITFDEVRVGSNYYGSCVTNGGNQNYCTYCNGYAAQTNCRSRGTTPMGSNGYAPYIGSAGSTAPCTGASRDVACSNDISIAIDEADTATFSLSFTP